MSGPCARMPLPGEPEYPEHLARLVGKQIERMTLAGATSSPTELGRAIVAMPIVRGLIHEAGR